MKFAFLFVDCGVWITLVGLWIVDFGSHQKWCEPRGTERSCAAFHTISGVVQIQFAKRSSMALACAAIPRGKNERIQSSIRIGQPRRLKPCYSTFQPRFRFTQKLATSDSVDNILILI